ncbi:hypothetical protein ACC699_03895 [Rhizobium ruizarguesonis]|uniref:hypothetical protein n=1 Tax=Rhizobium ruizarguesonis TaxID=2081791 RepID=UPI001FE13518|nr:hypothetical protein [Rhizobium ruizarguesonis]
MIDSVKVVQRILSSAALSAPAVADHTACLCATNSSGVIPILPLVLSYTSVNGKDTIECAHSIVSKMVGASKRR